MIPFFEEAKPGQLSLRRIGTILIMFIEEKIRFALKGANITARKTIGIILCAPFLLNTSL